MIGRVKIKNQRKLLFQRLQVKPLCQKDKVNLIIMKEMMFQKKSISNGLNEIHGHQKINKNHLVN